MIASTTAVIAFSSLQPPTSFLRFLNNAILVVLIIVLLTPSVQVVAFTPSHGTNSHRNTLNYQNDANVVRQQWVEKSVSYYSKVMREERRRSLGQSDIPLVSPLQLSVPVSTDQKDYLTLAKKHYFALRKVKDGKHQHAEHIYRSIIDELMVEDEDCDHAKLAVTTLLLALHMQRSKESVKQARSVFLNFFRVVTSADEHAPCACSAKVLQAFALFEMKQGNELKSYRIVLKAIELDPELRPVLKWKQFRNAHERYEKMRRRNSLAP